MRKITELSAKAFVNAQPFKLNNTEVIVLPNVTVFKLHGNEIAYLYNDPSNTLSITNCGWESDTTKERLNGILTTLNINIRIQQRNFKWIVYGFDNNHTRTFEKAWSGNKIDIINNKLSK